MFQDRSTYFPLRLKFSFFLSVILILFGCKTTKFVDSCISEIGFGSGGGVTGQAEALRLAISRALCEIDAENRPPLKAKGLMTRDPRMVERKKPGQKKARKKFQFSKR